MSTERTIDGESNIIADTLLVDGPTVLVGPVTFLDTLDLTTPLIESSGGTGQTSLTLVTVGKASNLVAGTTGEIPVQTAANTTSFLDPSTSGKVLTSNGVGVLPSFQTVVAPAAVGNLANGAAGEVPVQTAPSTTSFISPSTSGNVLTSNGVGVLPSYQTIPTQTTVANLASGATGEIPFQTAASTTSFLSPSTVGKVLTSNGVGIAPSFQTIPTPTTVSNLAGGAVGDIATQSGANTTTFLSPGASGTVVTSTGPTTAPVYSAIPATNLATGVTGTLGVGNGGTGQTNLASVQVGTATTAVNLNAGLTGQVPYQTGASTTGFIPLQSAGTVLTSNGVGAQPTFQAPQVGTVSGVLPVVNGGTGVTTSTGTTSVVLSNSPSLVTPNIGAASGSTLTLNGGVASTSFTTGTEVITGGLGVSGNIWIDSGGFNGGVNSSLGVGIAVAQFVVANGTDNATNTNTGALKVPSGGLGVGLDAYVGGHITAANGDNSNSASTGAIIAPNGGIGCSRDIWGGSRITANSTANGPIFTDPYSLRTEGGCCVRESLRVLNGPINAGSTLAYFGSVDASNTTQSTSNSTGAITTLGGIGIQRNAHIGGDLTVDGALSVGGTNLSYSSGTFTPVLNCNGAKASITANGQWVHFGKTTTMDFFIETLVALTAGPATFIKITNLPNWTTTGGAPYVVTFGIPQANPCAVVQFEGYTTLSNGGFVPNISPVGFLATSGTEMYFENIAGPVGATVTQQETSVTTRYIHAQITYTTV